MEASLIISIASAAASAAAVIVSIAAIISSNRVAATQMFLELRKSHNDIHSQMDIRYHDNNWNPLEDNDARKSLEKYWLCTLTEWYATVKLNGGKFEKLWDEFYVPAIVGGLRNKPLCIVLWEMLYGNPGSTFSGFRQEFGSTIETIYKNAFHKELREDINNS